MEFLLLSTLLLASYASPLTSNQRSPSGGDVAPPAHVITPFLKVIRTNDLKARDAVYYSPAVVVVAMNNTVKKCLYEDPNECEVIFNTSNKILSLSISGEYLYMGLLEPGGILKCSLDQKDSCTDFHKNNTAVFSLSIAGGHLYAGLYDGSILRCDLNGLNSCQTLHVLEKPVTSVMHFNEYIYAGLSNGLLMRCSSKIQNSCTTLYTTTEFIRGLSNVGNSIFAVTWDGLMWNCSNKSNVTADFCVSTLLNISNPYDITWFNDVFYSFQYEKGIKSKWANNTTWSEYGNFDVLYSMKFAYGTYKMQSRYRNENATCTWQSESKCPPFVAYYDEQERATLEVHVKDGRLYNSVGLLVDTSDADVRRSGPAAIFAMGRDGRLLLSNSHKKELVHTSSLFAGNPVSGAGEMTVKNGKIQKIRACSDHYQPDTILNRQVLQSLRTQGYTDHIDSVMCNEDDEVGQSESNYNTRLNELVLDS